MSLVNDRYERWLVAAEAKHHGGVAVGTVPSEEENKVFLLFHCLFLYLSCHFCWSLAFILLYVQKCTNDVRFQNSTVPTRAPMKWEDAPDQVKIEELDPMPVYVCKQCARELRVSPLCTICVYSNNNV